MVLRMLEHHIPGDVFLDTDAYEGEFEDRRLSRFSFLNSGFVPPTHQL